MVTGGDRELAGGEDLIAAAAAGVGIEIADVRDLGFDIVPNPVQRNRTGTGDVLTPGAAHGKCRDLRVEAGGQLGRCGEGRVDGDPAIHRDDDRTVDERGHRRLDVVVGEGNADRGASFERGTDVSGQRGNRRGVVRQDRYRAACFDIRAGGDRCLDGGEDLIDGKRTAEGVALARSGAARHDVDRTGVLDGTDGHVANRGFDLGVLDVCADRIANVVHADRGVDRGSVTEDDGDRSRSREDLGNIAGDDGHVSAGRDLLTVAGVGDVCIDIHPDEVQRDRTGARGALAAGATDGDTDDLAAAVGCARQVDLGTGEVQFGGPGHDGVVGAGTGRRQNDRRRRGCGGVGLGGGELNRGRIDDDCVVGLAVDQAADRRARADAVDDLISRRQEVRGGERDFVVGHDDRGDNFWLPQKWTADECRCIVKSRQNRYRATRRDARGIDVRRYIACRRGARVSDGYILGAFCLPIDQRDQIRVDPFVDTTDEVVGEQGPDRGALGSSCDRKRHRHERHRFARTDGHIADRGFDR